MVLANLNFAQAPNCKFIIFNYNSTSGREFTHALSFIKNKYHEFLTIEQQLNASFDQIFEN